MTCPECERYRKFIQAMIAEFDQYKANKTAQYYKQQCEKVLASDKNIKTTEN
jgi:hypothetical protein